MIGFPSASIIIPRGQVLLLLSLQILGKWRQVAKYLFPVSLRQK
jgi:hypothetical protein